MKLSNIAALVSCATVVISQPLDKRVLVVHTKYEDVVEIVYETVYVKAGEAPAPAIVNNGPHRIKHTHHSASKKPVVTPTPVPSPAEEEPAKVENAQPISSVVQDPKPAENKQPQPAVVQDPKPVENKQPQPAVVQDPKPAESKQPQPAVVQDPQPAENKQPQPAVVQNPKPASYDAQVAPLDKPKQANTGSSGGACGTVGGQCSGDLTFYEAGMGACGWVNNGLTEDVFALAEGMMGTQSNGNPFCGRSAKVTVGEKTVIAKLVDKCMDCKGASIDLSYHAIDQVMHRDIGRMHNVKWEFID